MLSHQFIIAKLSVLLLLLFGTNQQHNELTAHDFLLAPLTVNCRFI